MKKRKRKRSVSTAGFILASAVLVAAVVGILLYTRYGPSYTKSNLNDFYSVDGNEASIWIDNKRSGVTGLYENSHVYLSADAVVEFINARFYWNETENRLSYTLPLETVTVKEGDTSYTENGNSVDMGAPIVFMENGTAYIMLDYVKIFTDIEFKVYEEPVRVYIWDGSRTETKAQVSKDSKIRERGGNKSPIVSEVEKGETVLVTEELENWVRVLTDEGHIGYMRKTALGEREEVQVESSFVEPEYTNISLGEPVSLLWHQVFKESDNDRFDELTANISGVNVISPTWFALQGVEGQYENLGSREYVEKAHAKGLQVWVLADDFSSDVITYELFSDSEVRKNLAESLTADVLELGADGINIDFEGISEEAGPHYVQFLRELSVLCRKEGLVLSVDNYTPTGGRSHYNLTEQGKICDYVIIMGYDEHWRGSNAGSNASFSFVEEGINRALEMVPADRLINAVPFFTRIWKEIPEEKAQEGATIWEDGNSVFPRYAIESEACGMNRPWALLEEHGVTAEWLPELGQYYGEYEEDGCMIRIWIEDVRSLEEKFKLMKQKELAGAAYWKLGLESEDVWELISRYFG